MYGAKHIHKPLASLTPPEWITRPPSYASLRRRHQGGHRGHASHVDRPPLGTEVGRECTTHPPSTDENYLDIIAVVGALNLQLFNTTLNQLNSEYGITDPYWIGISILVLYNVGFFLQWASILDAVACKFLAIRYRTRPEMITPSMLLAASVACYVLMLALLLYPFYYGLYPHVTGDMMRTHKYNAMFYASAVPTISFLFIFPFWLYRQMRWHRQRAECRVLNAH